MPRVSRARLRVSTLRARITAHAGARGRAWALVSAGVLGCAGCTLLADFSDRAPAAGSACDGGGCEDATVTAEDSAALDARPLDAGVAPLDARGDVNAAACSGHKSGTYCANDGLHDYGGPPSDLVVCDGGAIASVRACDAGCLAMTNPFPDTCNECNAKPDGLYCGRDFPGFPATNADFLIQCQATNAVQIVACAHGCRSRTATTAAACAP